MMAPEKSTWKDHPILRVREIAYTKWLYWFKLILGLLFYLVVRNVWFDVVQHICNFGTMQTSQLVTVGPQHLLHLND